MALFARCKVFISAQFIGWWFVYVCLAMADLCVRLFMHASLCPLSCVPTEIFTSIVLVWLKCAHASGFESTGMGKIMSCNTGKHSRFCWSHLCMCGMVFKNRTMNLKIPVACAWFLLCTPCCRCTILCRQHLIVYRSGGDLLFW